MNQVEREALSKEYNTANNKVRQLIKEFDDLQLQNLAHNICEAKDMASMWRFYNKYKNDHKESESVSTPLQLINGNLTLTDKEKCDEFGRHLQTVHQTPNNPAFDLVFKRQIDEYFKEHEDQEFAENVMGNITVKRFRELLSLTKKKSASGEDDITYDAMKSCNDACLQVFCDIMNECLVKNYFPRSWKKAKIIMLPKPGKDVRKADGYRPISLLSCLGKIFERFVCDFLVTTLDKMKFFNQNQAGFQNISALNRIDGRIIYIV